MQGRRTKMSAIRLLTTLSDEGESYSRGYQYEVELPVRFVEGRNPSAWKQDRIHEWHDSGMSPTSREIGIFVRSHIEGLSIGEWRCGLRRKSDKVERLTRTRVNFSVEIE